MLLGGSTASASVICAASTVTVQMAPSGRPKSAVKEIELVVAPAPLNATGESTGHSRVNAEIGALTSSLKLITMVALVATLVAPLVGDVLVTDGAASPFAVTASEPEATTRRAGLENVLRLLTV